MIVIKAVKETINGKSKLTFNKTDYNKVVESLEDNEEVFISIYKKPKGSLKLMFVWITRISSETGYTTKEVEDMIKNEFLPEGLGFSDLSDQEFKHLLSQVSEWAFQNLNINLSRIN
jgi:hypothetical protein